MDLQGNTFIFGELKCTGVPLTVGQKLHLQWLVDAIEAGGKRAVAFYATHDTPLGEDVHVAKSVIKRLYTGGVWVTMDVTVEEYINEIL